MLTVAPLPYRNATDDFQCVGHANLVDGALKGLKRRDGIIGQIRDPTHKFALCGDKIHKYELSFASGSL